MFDKTSQRSSINNGKVLKDRSEDVKKSSSDAQIDVLLDEKQTAAKLDLSPGTLAVWRSTGRYGLVFVKVGRKVRYRVSDLDNWLASRTRANGATE